MWGTRFLGAREVGPWVGEQKPLGKTPLRGNPSPEKTYLPTYLPTYLEVEHAVIAKTAPKSAPQNFRVGDPMWVRRPQPMGTHCTKIASKWAPNSSGNKMEVNSVPVSLTSEGNMGPWTRLPMGPTRTTTILSNNDAVERILVQRLSASAPGGVEFKVRCRG